MIIIRRNLLLVLVLCTLGLFPSVAMAAGANEEKVEVFLGDKVIVNNNETVFPLKEIMDACGITTFWRADSQDKILIVENANRYEIILSIDHDTGVIYAGTTDDNTSYLATVVDGHVYFAQDFYNEILDREVVWRSGSGMLSIIDDSPNWMNSGIVDKNGKEIYSNKNSVIKGLSPYKIESVSRSTAVREPAKGNSAQVIPVDEAGMIWPTTATRISSNYGKRGKSFHSGLDIDGVTGDPVYAALSGQVVFAGWSNGYGKCINIQHADGTITRYAHLNQIDVKQGEIVGRGQVIGQVGSTGRSSGDHLHFEVRKGKYTYNPKDYITVSRRS